MQVPPGMPYFNKTLWYLRYIYIYIYMYIYIGCVFRYLMETSDADMLQDILIDTVIADAHAAAIEN